MDNNFPFTFPRVPIWILRPVVTIERGENLMMHPVSEQIIPSGAALFAMGLVTPVMEYLALETFSFTFYRTGRSRNPRRNA